MRMLPQHRARELRKETFDEVEMADNRKLGADFAER
jgi:hypothetical protein